MKAKVQVSVFGIIAIILLVGSWFLIDFDKKEIYRFKEDIAPEFTTAITEREAVTSINGMVATANPYASKIAMDVLCEGGNALDAAIAAQMALNLVEPQSSGIGGGGFLLYYHKKSGRIYAYDGRETAPKEIDSLAFLDKEGSPKDLFTVYTGGLSVGVPGLLRMLEMAHRKHGSIEWKKLFTPAIRLSEKGFTVSPRMHAHLSNNERLKQFKPARELYFQSSEKKAVAEGESLKNPQLAETFRLVAEKGADVFYTGSIAEDIVRSVDDSRVNPGKMTMEDLENYRAIEKKPVSLEYKDYIIVGFPPPSSGGITILQIMGIVEALNIDTNQMNSAEIIHLIAEASNLAFADRNRYLADPDFVEVPMDEMLDKEYLRQRASLILRDQAMPKAEPGHFKNVRRVKSPVSYVEVPSTTHISIVDPEGNAVAMTTSIEQAFGSGLVVRGFLLNNQMTDFSFNPLKNDLPKSNRIEPGKRPRSSMAPTLVFNKKTGELLFVIGAPGGARIISYVTKALIGVLDFQMDTQEAISFPNFSSRNGPLEIEQNTSLVELVPQLEDMGHEVNVIDLNSGSQGIQVDGEKLTGGADPRRESFAIGADWCEDD